VIGAGNRDRLAALADAAAENADCLISFGIAGGLAPILHPGAVILSGEVADEECRWTTDEDLLRRLDRLAPSIGVHRGTVYGARAILAGRSAKDSAYRKTGALAVDLESAIAARSAAAANIPFLVLRAVADPAGQDLPPAASLPLRPQGSAALGRILAEISRRPGQIPDLVRLGWQTRAALAALVAPARALRRLLDGGETAHRVLDVT